MLVIFIVAFIVTLTAAVYMQFGSRAEEHVLRHKLDPDAFLLGAVCMGALSIFALANSGFSNGVGLAILFFSWIPCALIAVSIEKHQQNLCKLSVTPAGLNAQLAASWAISEFGRDTCDRCLEQKRVRRFFDQQHGWILSLCVDSTKCEYNNDNAHSHLRLVQLPSGWDHDEHRPLPSKEQWESAITVSKNK